MRQGVPQADIARQYGVTRQYVHKFAKQGGHDALVTKVTENFPWKITDKMYSNTVYQHLRLLGHFQLDPTALSESSKAKVTSFLRKLTTFNRVVDYDPSYPAIPGISNTPGFAYRPRHPRDEDYVIKIRPGVRLTNIGKEIWRLPEKWP